MVLWYDLSGYAGATINNAELRLSCFTGNMPMYLSAIKSHAWAEGNKDGDYPGVEPSAPGVSWADPDGTHTKKNNAILGWGAASDQFFSETENGDDIYNWVGFFSTPVGAASVVCDVTSIVQDWVSGTKDNYGFYVDYSNHGTYMSEAGTADQPVLFIDYALP
jgi:hypothetical protein